MAGTKAASRSRGAAARSGAKRGTARSEVNGEATTISITNGPLKNLKLIGPKTLPSTFSWDYAELQARIKDDDVFSMGALYRILISLIGETQGEQVRAKLVSANANGDDSGGAAFMVELLNDVIAAYGTDAGES